MDRFVIDHPNNEASALVGVQNTAFLERHGFEFAFWIVSDELDVSRAIAALGCKSSGEWSVVRLQTARSESSTTKECVDSETLARAGSHVYVFGSQYGSKKGPLQPKRHFVARFNEALIELEKNGTPRVELDVVRRPFVLHRLINDAFRELRIDVLPPGEELSRDFVHASMKRGEKRGSAWVSRIHADDVPINVEGATFLEGGRLLLGLRHPVTRDGHPLIVEIEGIDRLFETDAPPPGVVTIHILSNVGSKSRPAAIRELDSRSGWVHAITGSLDSSAARSAVLHDHPEGKRTPIEHWAFRRAHDGSGGPVKAQRVRKFGRKARVEGVALQGDQAWYAHDADLIELDCADLQMTE